MDIISRDLITIKKKMFSKDKKVFIESLEKQKSKKIKANYMVVTKKSKDIFKTLLFDLINKEGCLQYFYVESKNLNHAITNHSNISKAIKTMVEDDNIDISFKNFKYLLSTF